MPGLLHLTGRSKVGAAADRYEGSRRVFKEFGEIYAQASPGAKRRILNIIIEEIGCSVKRGERKGEILCRLRGDGSVTREWEQARKHEDPKPPSSGGSSLQGAWLREQDSNHRR
jgi:hypothetical protein